jgi:hypothetical protein
VIVDTAQLHADPEAPHVFRANRVRVITLPPHCTDWVRPVDAAWAKSFKDRFSPLVRCPTEQNVLRLFDQADRRESDGRARGEEGGAKFVMWS